MVKPVKASDRLAAATVDEVGGPGGSTPRRSVDELVEAVSNKSMRVA